MKKLLLQIICICMLIISIFNIITPPFVFAEDENTNTPAEAWEELKQYYFVYEPTTMDGNQLQVRKIGEDYYHDYSYEMQTALAAAFSTSETITVDFDSGFGSKGQKVTPNDYFMKKIYYLASGNANSNSSENLAEITAKNEDGTPKYTIYDLINKKIITFPKDYEYVINSGVDMSQVSETNSLTTSDVSTDIKDRAKKIWGVFKAYGFSDEMCAGMLGNMLTESSGTLNPTAIEGISAADDNIKANAQSMGDKSYSKEQIWLNPKYASDYVVNDLFINGYTSSPLVSVPYQDGDTKIELLTDVFGNSNTQQKKIFGTSGYFAQYPTASDKHFAPGLGIIQFTGSEVTRLWKFANKSNMNPWDLKLQCATLICPKGDFGYQVSRMKTLMEKKDTLKDVESATKYIFSHWVNQNREFTSNQQSRVDYAKAVESGKYGALVGTDGDVEFAKEVFKIAGLPWPNPYRDFSLTEEFISPVVEMEISDGSALFTLDEEKQLREQINNEIYLSIKNGVSTNENTYSLYDRFGPKLQFIQYYGEETVGITLFDHIVSTILQGAIGDLSIKEIVYSPPIYLSNKVYEGRPFVLTRAMVDAGYKDPRVTMAANDHIGTRFGLVHSKLLLGISQTIVSVVSFLLSNTIQWFVYDKFRWFVQTEAWTVVIKNVFWFLMAALGIVFIFHTIKHARKYLLGNESLKQLLTRLIVVLLTFSLLILLITSPTFVLDTTYKVTTFTDSLFGEMVESRNQDDEVISSKSSTYASSKEETSSENTVTTTTGETAVKESDADSTESKIGKDSPLQFNNATEAWVWKIALFQPWCKGTFGDRYENLYTQFYEGELKKDVKKMEQSYVPDHKALDSIKLDSENSFYDSASLTGDVKVDLGGGKQVRNWAALLWSTTSTYHIDTTTHIKEESITASSVKFPTALRTSDGSLYADMFRVIDAKMDISPQYLVENDEVVELQNYTNAKIFETNYYGAGWEMLWKSLLLLALLPILIMKLKAYFVLILQFVKGLYYGMVEFVTENQGLSKWWADIKESVVNYMYRSLQAYILIYIYCTFTDLDNFLLNIAFVLLAVIITFSSFRDVIGAVDNIKRNIKRLV